MKFTPEEKALAKQLHELGVKKDIKEGDWYIHTKENERAFPPSNFKRFKDSKQLLWIQDASPSKLQLEYYGIIFLWQIHDCIPWIQEKGYEIKLIDYTKDEQVKHWAVFDAKNSLATYAKTPLEALLKAMVAIAKKEQ